MSNPKKAASTLSESGVRTPLLSTQGSNYNQQHPQQEQQDARSTQPHGDEHATPELCANFVSRLFLLWLNPLFKTGHRRIIQEGDLYPMLPNLRGHVLGRRLRVAWENECRRAARERARMPNVPQWKQTKNWRSVLFGGIQPSLLRAIYNVFWKIHWASQVCMVVSESVEWFLPFVLRVFLIYLSEAYKGGPSAPSATKGYLLAFSVLSLNLMSLMIGQKWRIFVITIAVSVRTALMDTMLHKVTRLSPKARTEFEQGRLFNLLTNDPWRIEEPIAEVGMLFFVPLSVIVTTGLLIRLIGPSALVGAVFLLTINPALSFIMSRLGTYRAKAAALTDSRIKILTEILQGIRVVKMYAWEKSFLKSIADLRVSELSGIKVILQTRGVMFAVSNSLPVLAAGSSFALYAALGNPLDVTVIFPALSLFSNLRVPLIVLPFIYSSAVDGLVSIERMEALLMAEDSKPKPPVQYNHPFAMSIQDADFYWDQPSNPKSNAENMSSDLDDAIATPPKTTNATSQNVSNERQPLLTPSTTITTASSSGDSTTTLPPCFLRNINVNISRGSLVAVVGPVGSGKSSLLQAMIGSMSLRAGSVTQGSDISYAAQTPWIQNATVRDIILFDSLYDEERYQRVVRACCLEKDLAMFPDGDMTEIGERGVNLSGGQKARLSLARSVYFDADMIVMDDPLSAVDAHVGRHLWHECILGELQGRTRVIATHQLHVLPDVDYILYMAEGTIVEQGTFVELMNQHNGLFRKLMQTHGGTGRHNTHGINRQSRRRSLAMTGAFQDDEQTLENSSDDEEADYSSEENSDGETPQMDEARKQPAVLMAEEEMEVGAIKSQVYLDYFRQYGLMLWSIIVLMLFLQHGARIMMNVWLSIWSEGRYNYSTVTSISIYMGIGLIQCLFLLVASILTANAMTTTARLLHDRALRRVLSAPLSFFETTPVGRVLNRFSKDVGAMDDELMGALNEFINVSAGIVCTVLLVIVYLPWMTVIVAPLMWIYYLISEYFRSTSREIKRLDSILRSHQYSILSETLTGLETLKVFSKGIDRAIIKNENQLDRSNKAYYLYSICIRWMAIRSFAVGHSVTFGTMVAAVYMREILHPAVAGLILSYLSGLASEMNWANISYFRLESTMNSAERLKFYAEDLPQEPPAENPHTKPAITWPSQGEIVFKDVSLRYRPGLPLVLRNVSFYLNAGTKVGIVGRTGAGKSSLIQALFRLVELDQGQIFVDGIETGTLGTADLRTKIAIIPQDPVLFKGTFRYNLDPMGRHTDDELWRALETSDLRNYVQEQEGGLDAIVAAHGENLSVGQRQLVCLSRALLTKSKVVVLDEATASVDLATDALIQKAIREDFAASTVITIAHRLNTIIDYDKVLVMDRGQVAEFDTPRRLLEKSNSIFGSLIDETGEQNAALLRSIAAMQ